MKIDRYFILAFLLFLSSNPMYAWISSAYSWILIPLVFLFFIKEGKKISSILSLFLLVILEFYQIAHENILGKIIIDIQIVLVFLLSYKSKIQVFYHLRNIFCFFTILAVISFVLVRFINLPLPFINYVLPYKGITYRIYPFFVAPVDTLFFMYRFCGFYDEPGLMGSYVGIFLLLDKFNLRDYKNIALFLAGLLSMSFFFYLLAVFYGLYYLWVKKSLFKIAFFCLLAVSFFIVTKDNEFLNTTLYYRLELNNSGKLEGDNRTSELFDDEYDKFSKTNDFYWGRGWDATSKAADGSSSYKMLIYENGIIWFSIFIIFWLSLTFTSIKSSSNRFLFIVIIASMVYQRPSLLTLFVFWILSTGVGILNIKNSS